MNNSEITTAIGREGLGKQSWWVEQWMELINSYRYKKRLERAWGYAREGNVTSIRFEGRRIHARVQGTENKPYKVKIWLDILDDEDWGYVIDALAQKAKWSAQLLAGVMPKDIEQAFATTGKRLFPFNLQEVKSECNCPDPANPCKHVSAVYFLMGEQFKEDPFILFQLRGKDKNTLLSDLVNKRRFKKKENVKATDKLKNTSNSKNKRFKDKIMSTPDLWWSYTSTLDDDLVVITSSTEKTSGASIAGDLPLAANPEFPESQIRFIKDLISFSQVQAQKAMISAMSVNTENESSESI
ncbi:MULTISPECIES: swim zn-finger containing protein [unclassified Prochlorococcus]|uniref:SWIM zinc finger family protein n=1 Tax=unclassified Prochlorococcus TaxID=2627481 RepID=UPI00053375EE|nr:MULTISPECIES: swim zn-finger containing protein [unclassified Prochlorococcus]KGG16905.1 hypothetical protein EV06_0752 [Prochlorococcus sp. MIT 0602]KGG18120.1 hypothetical protein EV07_0032 [Prochlorococcus sp. MIT 0603]